MLKPVAASSKVTTGGGLQYNKPSGVVAEEIPGLMMIGMMVVVDTTSVPIIRRLIIFPFFALIILYAVVYFSKLISCQADFLMICK